jgi:hypothetical protein
MTTTNERHPRFVVLQVCCTEGTVEEYDPVQVSGWLGAATLDHLMHDHPTVVREGTSPNLHGRIAETIASDLHGTLTVATRNGLAAWHREQTDPRYAWITGRYRTGDRE